MHRAAYVGTCIYIDIIHKAAYVSIIHRYNAQGCLCRYIYRYAQGQIYTYIRV